MIDNKKYYEMEKKGSNKDALFPSISGNFVKDKESFFDTGECGPNRFYQKNYVFDYLLPIYRDELEQINEPEFFVDYNFWHTDEPSGGRFTPVSPKFKELIKEFNFPPNKFYSAKILHKKEHLPFFVWQVFEDTYEEYIDFKVTEFNNLDTNGELEDGLELEVKKFNSIDELEAYSDKHWDYNFNYQRLVMKPSFRKLDFCIIPIKLGIVVSERLKNAIEKSSLIGISFKELPIAIEFSDNVK